MEKFVSGDGKVFESLEKAIVYAEKFFEKSGIVIAIEKKREISEDSIVVKDYYSSIKKGE
jgi:CRISPR/Cas system-associated endonuclease Cas3-HD